MSVLKGQIGGAQLVEFFSHPDMEVAANLNAHMVIQLKTGRKKTHVVIIPSIAWVLGDIMEANISTFTWPS
jgi:hypothetical protein